MLPDTVFDRYTPIVGKYLWIDDVTTGQEKDHYLVRYRGKLKTESSQAYDNLAAELKAENLTPLFRKEQDRAAIFLVSGVVNARPSNPWVNLILFFLTLFSMMFAGTLFYLRRTHAAGAAGDDPNGPGEYLGRTAVCCCPVSNFGGA